MQLERETSKGMPTELQILIERVKELEPAESESELLKKALSSAENLLCRFFESSPDLLSVIDKNFRVIRSNWHGGYEYVPEEIRAQKPLCYSAYYPGQERPCDPCHILEVFNTGRPVVAEKVNPKIGHLETHAYPLFDDSGDVALVVQQVINISDRKQALEEMHKSNQRLDFLAEMAGQLLKSEFPQKALETLCHKVLSLLDCQAFFNYLVDEEKNVCILTLSEG